MKYLFLIATFISFNLSLNMFEINYNIATFTQQSLAEQYYDKLEVKTNLPKMLNKFLDKKALVRTEVPLSVWQDIKDNIDYISFRTQIVEVIPLYYTDSELLSLINSYTNNPNIPITKLSFRTELSQKIESFNSSTFINTVNTILSNNGYNPL